MNEQVKTSPCLGCGFCCMKAPCFVALRVHGNGITQCPELRWNNDRYTCRLATLPGSLGDRYREELAIGAGCCCGLNDWRKDVKQRDLNDANPARHTAPSGPSIPPMMQSFLAILGRQFISGDAIALICRGWKGQLIKDGMSEAEAESLMKLASHYVRGNRSKFMEDFMG